MKTKAGSRLAAGWRCTWKHATSNDEFVGELWPDRETADDIAEMLRAAGCRDVKIVSWRQRP